MFDGIKSRGGNVTGGNLMPHFNLFKLFKDH